MNDMNLLFSKMVGTLAVVLLIAGFIGGSDIISKWMDRQQNRRKYAILAGIVGGLFGIYGNISGFELNGAVISVRDIGPMLAGFLGGPVGGIIAGLLAGLHRLMLGGITAKACVVATCCIGIMCGVISKFKHDVVVKPYWALLISAVMETFHLGVVLIMVKPFETAFGIVRQIAVPFVAVNALGFAMMIAIMSYTERQRNMAIERSRLQSELEVANVIQHSLLPDISGTYPGRAEVDVSACMEAAKEVGGDFYDVFFVEKDKIAFVIGDVSGKGVPAALFMASSKIILQNCVRDIPELGAALSTANNAICARNEADMFVTIWVGILDISTGKITAVNAGHDDPAVYRNGYGFDFAPAKHGLVAGGMPGAKYRESEIQLEKGDKLFIYTDGVPEATDKDNKMFTVERMLDSLNANKEKSPAGILEGIKQSVNEFVGDAPQFDDLTMLCLEYKGSDTCEKADS
jgi:sigma-B regulation protein RsbU (phosphoserine phosphatase)